MTQEITDQTKQPVCSVCGGPLHVLRGGLQARQAPDGTLGVVAVSVMGCQNGNYGGRPCPLAGQAQTTDETPVNTFDE